MKRSLIGIVLILVALIIFYLIIPSTKTITLSVKSNCVATAVARQMNNRRNLHLWWPGQIKNDSIYSYQNSQYRFDKIRLNGIETTINFGKDSIKGFLEYVFLGNDSTAFVWSATYNFSANPIERINEYIHFKIIEKNITGNIADLLNAIKKYFDNPVNVYGLKIVRGMVSESAYISTKTTFTNYPSTKEIYTMIEALKNYIQKSGGEELPYPMLHVEKEGPAIFETMVAIPTKSALPSTEKFQLKKMILGHMLIAEVTGGTYTILKGEEEFTNYVKDHNILSPAIPFQSIVTNRLSEADTTKWITQLNYPIFQ